MGTYVVTERTPEVAANHTIHWDHAFAAASGSAKNGAEKQASVREEYLFQLATTSVSCAVLLGCVMSFMESKPEDGLHVFELLVAFSVGICSCIALCYAWTLSHAVRAVSSANFLIFLKAENTAVLNKNLKDVTVYGCGFGFMLLLSVRVLRFAMDVIDNSLPNRSLIFRIIFAVVAGVAIILAYIFCTIRPYNVGGGLLPFATFNVPIITHWVLVSFAGPSGVQKRQLTQANSQILIRPHLFFTFHIPPHPSNIQYGGLMDDEEVVPVGKKQGWARTCSPQYIAQVGVVPFIFVNDL